MRILLVAPGPRFSTYDTFKYYYRAFGKLGHKTFAFRYHDHFAYHYNALLMIDGLEGDEITGEEDVRFQRQAATMASELLISRIVRVRPDLIFMVSGLATPPQVWKWLIELRKGLNYRFNLAILFTESPYIEEEQRPLVKYADIAITMDKSSLNLFRELNPNSIYVPHAYDSDAHYMRIRDGDHAADVFMVGTGFPERIRLLSSIDWSGIDIRIFGGNWGDIEESKCLEGLYSIEFLDNESQVASYYSNSKISLNIFRTAKLPGESVDHIDPRIAYSISPRCYEIMACGGFLLTDTRPELYELFDVGKELVVYDGPVDLEEKIKYYLSRDKERKSIAMSGLKAVGRHTYESRAASIVEYIESIGE